MAPNPPPVTVFTFFLALPFAVPLPDRTSPGFVDRRTPAWDGWSSEDLAQLVGQKEPFSPDTIPGTRMAIRHHEAPYVIPFVAVFDAFVNWIQPPLSEEEFEGLRADTDAHREDGMQVVESIAALSRFIPRSEHPVTGAVTVGWLLDVFREALADFNKLLEALGLVTRRWDLGTLPPRILPPLIPLLVESSHPNEAGERQGTTSIIPLHDAVPTPAAVFDPKAEDFDAAAGLTNATNRGEQPYMLAFRLIHAAEGERLAGDPTRAVIDLNTAIEVVVSITLTEGGRIVGWTEDEISTATGWRTGLKKRVEKYLSDLTGNEIDPTDQTSAWGNWFSGGYRLRNAAAHEGKRLAKADVDRALDGARNLISNLRGELEAAQALKPLGEKLSFDLGTEPPWEDQLVHLKFPWD